MLSQLKPRGRGLRVLCLGPRITFNLGLWRRLNDTLEARGLTFQFYQDIRASNDPNCVVYQPESLHQLSNARWYDVLFIDEVNAVLESLTCPLNRSKRKANLTMFHLLLRSTPFVIAADAFLGRKAIDVILQAMNSPRTQGEKSAPATYAGPVTPANTVFHRNVHRAHMLRIVEIHRTTDSISWALRDTLDRGYRVAICCGTKRRAKQLDAKLRLEHPGIRVRTYHHHDQKTDPNEAMKDFRLPAEQFEQMWTDADVVIYTCCLRVGTDYAKFGHFAAVFAYIENNRVSAESYIQMLGRVRDLWQSAWHLYVGTPSTSRRQYAPLSLAEIREYSRQKEDYTIRVEQQYQLDGEGLGQHDFFQHEGKSVWRRADDWVSLLMSYNLLEASLSFNRMLQELLWFLKDRGPTQPPLWTANNRKGKTGTKSAAAAGDASEGEAAEGEAAGGEAAGGEAQAQPGLSVQARNRVAQQLRKLRKHCLQFPNAPRTMRMAVESQQSAFKQKILTLKLLLTKTPQEVYQIEHKQGFFIALQDQEKIVLPKIQPTRRPGTEEIAKLLDAPTAFFRDLNQALKVCRSLLKAAAALDIAPDKGPSAAQDGRLSDGQRGRYKMYQIVPLKLRQLGDIAADEVARECTLTLVGAEEEQQSGPADFRRYVFS
eukprot:g22652.t1